MKKTTLILSVCLLALGSAGCQLTQFEHERWNPNGSYERSKGERKTFGTKTDFGAFRMNPTTNGLPRIELENYQHDQVEGIQATGEAVGTLGGTAVRKVIGR